LKKKTQRGLASAVPKKASKTNGLRNEPQLTDTYSIGELDD